LSESDHTSSVTSGAPLDYRSAGVDIDASDDAKHRIRALVESTYTAGVRGAFGAFGGMFRMPSDISRPLLVASADGVGTKTRVAIDAGRHDTIGHDLVNHCVNDILVQGATPLFFLDYVAFGRLEPEVVEAVVAGVAAGCRENGCALLGGETAEMPGIYTPPDYDLAGFIVGCVGEDRVPGPDRVREGDVLIGLASSGLHTNGFSLARRIVADRMKLRGTDRYPGLDTTVSDALLAVHASYLRAVSPVLDIVHAMAHITGGGLPGNLDRAIPASVDAIVNLDSWNVPVLFRELQRAGDVAQAEMFRSFNMGVGMVVICDHADASSVIHSCANANVVAWSLGHIRPGSGRVVLE
jgi:phosphoribosylformylglycinamidine cyclo-ligase